MCVVIPVEREDLYCCVGFTSVVEAMAMSKPIISTRNPYYPIDLGKEGIGIYVDDIDSWVNAITYIHILRLLKKWGKRKKTCREKF